MIITVTAFNGYSRRAWEHKPGRRRGTALGNAVIITGFEKIYAPAVYIQVALPFWCDSALSLIEEVLRFNRSRYGPVQKTQQQVMDDYRVEAVIVLNLLARPAHF